MRTHYQNLKVPETASEREIRTAYRKLCHQYHPDKAPGDPEALRIMQIINDAYEVLSDPARRADYDQRLRVLRMMPGNGARTAPMGERYTGRPMGERYPPGPVPGRERGPPYGRGTAPRARQPSYRRPPRDSIFGDILGSLSGRGVLLLIWLVFMLARMFHSDSPASAPFPLHLPDLPLKSGSGRVHGGVPGDMPPGFRNWIVPAYLPGYPVLFNDGISSLTIDNEKNDADVRLELVRGELVARSCFIPARTAFTLEGIGKGTYYVRYRDLNSDKEFRTNEFDMEQAYEADGVRFNRNALVLTRDGHRLSRRPRFQRNAVRPAGGGA